MQPSEAVVVGAVAGLLLGSLMTLVDAPFWRKMGMHLVHGTALGDIAAAKFMTIVLGNPCGP